MSSEHFVQERNGWRFAACKAKLPHGDRWVAWCAKTDDLGDGPLDPRLNDMEVHFMFGLTRDEALEKLARDRRVVL